MRQVCAGVVCTVLPVLDVSSPALLPLTPFLQWTTDSCKYNLCAAGEHGVNIIMKRYFLFFTKLHCCSQNYDGKHGQKLIDMIDNFVSAFVPHILFTSCDS